MRHKHSWEWKDIIYGGRKGAELAILRKCNGCDLKQVAFIPAKSWQKAMGYYASDERYK